MIKPHLYREDFIWYNILMIPSLKKHFIPHAGNDHRPHILRNNNIRNIVILVLLLEVFTFLIPTLIQINRTGGMAAVLPAILADLTNEKRESQNLSILTTNPILVQAAELKAKDMATKGYFAHTSPEGKTPWYWLELTGYKYQYAGENLAINFSDSKDVTDAWMASPTHRANIVKDKYTEVGTGIATGLYEGKETVFVAQIYANPLKEIKTQITPIKTETPKVNVPPKIALVEKINNESSNVLGAEVTPPTQIASTILVTPEIKGVNDNSINQPQKITLWQKVIASPRNTTKTILCVIFGVITIALLLYIFIKRRNHHLGLITNGLIVLAIIGAILSANYYVTHRNMIITQSFDYSNEIK